jgi:dUTP pyrophosphatase
VTGTALLGQRRIGVKLLSAHAQMPTRTYPDDAGFDLYVSETVRVLAGEFVDVHCGVALDLPPDCWAMLTGRSSTLRRHGLLVNQGIIDPGYRGELYAGVWNLNPNGAVKINRGERLAQILLMSNRTMQHSMVRVEALSTHPRGSNGFGSSGA